MGLAQRHLRIAESAGGIIIGLIGNSVLRVAIRIVAAEAHEASVGFAEVLIHPRDRLPGLAELGGLHRKIQSVGKTAVRIREELEISRATGSIRRRGNNITRKLRAANRFRPRCATVVAGS